MEKPTEVERMEWADTEVWRVKKIADRWPDMVVMSLQLASPIHRTFLIMTIADNGYQLALSQTQ